MDDRPSVPPVGYHVVYVPREYEDCIKKFIRDCPEEFGWEDIGGRILAVFAKSETDAILIVALAEGQNVLFD